jgi:hypothetical protein
MSWPGWRRRVRDSAKEAIRAPTLSAICAASFPLLRSHPRAACFCPVSGPAGTGMPPCDSSMTPLEPRQPIAVPAPVPAASSSGMALTALRCRWSHARKKRSGSGQGAADDPLGRARWERESAALPSQNKSPESAPIKDADSGLAKEAVRPLYLCSHTRISDKSCAISTGLVM